MINAGGVTAAIIGISTTGDFAQTDTCGNIIPAHAKCTISVTFKPTASGNRIGNLTLVDNAGNSPQAVSLSGKGGRR